MPFSSKIRMIPKAARRNANGSPEPVGFSPTAKKRVNASNLSASATDIETLFDQLPEPIDMDPDLANRMMYWSDRGDPPRGNTISRAPMDPNKGPQQILVGGLKEGIGMALDLKDKRMFYTDLGGNVYGANMDGTDVRVLLSGQGALTGITWVDIKN